jgi:hypothetical protein
MNQSQSSNEYLVNEKIIEEFIQKKDQFMCERNKKAFLNTLYTIAITGLYYYDIYTDIDLCWQYYKDGDIWWFGYTLGIVLFSSLFNTFILFYYSYLQEFKFNWKKKEYRIIVFKSFCLLFQLEMLFW